MIGDVFRGEKTEAVTPLLQKETKWNKYVSNNMTDNFQWLDFRVNKWVKGFMKQQFNEWFATQLRTELQSGKEFDKITIRFIFSTMKPLYAGWLIACYNQLTSLHRKEIILAGWRASGISAAVENGLISFLIHPINKIDPLTKLLKSTWLQSFSPCLKSILKKKWSMMKTKRMSFAIWKIWISTENKCY